jgi:ketosteroid isomerase-like protein
MRSAEWVVESVPHDLFLVAPTHPDMSHQAQCVDARGAAARGCGAVDIATLIDRYDDAWNAQDLDAISAMHDDAMVFENHTAGERSEGAAAVRAHIGGILARWPTLRFIRRRLRCGEAFAVSEWTARATHPEDGRRLEWDGVDVFTVTAGGRLASKDTYSTSRTPRVLVS